LFFTPVSTNLFPFFLLRHRCMICY
jgi:hypothetical protein